MSRVFVYRNIRKGCWSLKALDGPRKGHVIRHCRSVSLYGVEARVQEGGRQRVLREGVKNVHAGLVGHYNGATNPASATWTRISYNPRKGPHFVDSAGAAITGAGRAVLREDGTVVARDIAYLETCAS